MFVAVSIRNEAEEEASDEIFLSMFGFQAGSKKNFLKEVF
jgi:hypothetical protein